MTGLALNRRKIKEVIGVVKAYTTRVGGGPIPTEQLNAPRLCKDLARTEPQNSAAAGSISLS